MNQPIKGFTISEYYVENVTIVKYVLRNVPCSFLFASIITKTLSAGDELVAIP